MNHCIALVCTAIFLLSVFHFVVIVLPIEFVPTARSMKQTSFLTRPEETVSVSTQHVTLISALPIVRVALTGWASEELPLKTYTCAQTKCITYKHTSRQMNYDILVSTNQPIFPFLLRNSKKKRYATIALESTKHPNFVNPEFFPKNTVDLVIRYQPPNNTTIVQFLPTSYINADINSFMVSGKDNNFWVDYEFRDPGMLAVISNCRQTHNKRLDMLNNLVKIFSRVYKFGKCFKNDKLIGFLPTALQRCMILPRGNSIKYGQKECMLKKMMFSFSIENSFEYGYITEKLWQALKMGAIPVYSVGALENRRFLPHPDSALIIEDFESIEHLAKYMQQVSMNRTLWFKHAMAWRYLPITEVSNDFVSAVNNSLVTLPCRLCDWWLRDTSEKNV